MFVNEESRTAEIVASLFASDFHGVYVDVGAGFPEWYSNSYPFRVAGWNVVAIEPQPNMCEKFRERGFDILQFACSSKNLGIVDFEVLDNTGGLAGSSFKILDDHPQEMITVIQVEARTLSSLLAEFHPELGRIDVLDVDVEYYELEVLRGVDFEKYRPKVLVIENLPESGTWNNKDHHALHDFYDSHEYRMVGRCGHNEILVDNV